MKKNVVRINEGQLKKIVVESVKSVVKEISLRTIDNAERKSGGYESYRNLNNKSGFGSRVHDAIGVIENELEYYANSLHNGQARKLISYLDPIRDFFNRKGEQASNFTDAREDERNAAEGEFDAKAREMFNKNHRALSDEEYEAVLRSCSPRTQEYAEIYFEEKQRATKKNETRLNESKLRMVISETVKKVLKEKYGDSNWFLNNDRRPPIDYENGYGEEERTSVGWDSIKPVFEEYFDGNNKELPKRLGELVKFTSENQKYGEFYRVLVDTAKKTIAYYQKDGSWDNTDEVTGNPVIDGLYAYALSESLYDLFDCLSMDLMSSFMCEFFGYEFVRNDEYEY